MIRTEIPVVSVIIPARNEEACLGACLESLVSQDGTTFEIIVVDDASTDRTPEIARSFVKASVAADPQARPPGTHVRSSNEDARGHGTSSLEQAGTDTPVRPAVRIIPAGPLPKGWTGKNNAMAAGAKLARGKWLLFTDADTVHKPGSLARAVAEAEEHRAALLSYSPEQEVRTFWEHAVMPVIFAELAAAYSPSKVRDPASPIAAANGQYLMISREVYDAIGGHAKIAGDLLEDVAMARLVKSSGRRVFFRFGADAVRTRMYRNWAQMKEGWTKNLALLFRHPVRRAALLLTFWVFSWITFVMGLWAIAQDNWRPSYYLLPLFFLYGRIARGRFRPAANLVGLAAGIPLTAYLLCCSAWAQKNRGVTWKGRKYHAKAA